LKENDMQVVIVTERNEALHEFAQGLGGDVEWAKRAEDVLGRAKTPPWQLVVVDAMTPGMDYKTFVMDLLRVNAMLNTVVITDMGKEAFHEDSEGLGVLCAVPANPKWDDGAKAMNLLCVLYGMG
jgi:DNA-binding response OmpR family regulator